jgi:hypothetical protein
MARAILRDDPWSGGPTPDDVTVVLDDDLATVTAGLDDDPGAPWSDVVVGPTLSVKDRVAAGLDDDDNPMWTWVERAVDVGTIMWEQRTETDRRSGMTKVLAKTSFLYPVDDPDVRETASARTDDGLVWSIRSVTRIGGVLTLEMERIDDGA